MSPHNGSTKPSEKRAPRSFVETMGYMPKPHNPACSLVDNVEYLFTRAEMQRLEQICAPYHGVSRVIETFLRKLLTEDQKNETGENTDET